jgi:hypothetical protein
MCTVLLPPGVNPTAVKKYIISYQKGHNRFLPHPIYYSLPSHHSMPHSLSYSVSLNGLQIAKFITKETFVSSVLIHLLPTFGGTVFALWLY